MLNRKVKYLQIALNNSLHEARDIIDSLPVNPRIILEAGTPLVKREGIGVVSEIKRWWQRKIENPYIVADLKTMDRGETEVKMAVEAGASGIIGLGQAPIETIDVLIDSCARLGADSMLDMMNIEHPVKVLRKLKRLPDVVVLHRGVDEETFNRDKPIPYIQINKLRATYDVLVSIAGGDTIREVQRSIFNGADIVVVWKEFFTASGDTGKLAEEFLKEIK